MGKYVFPFLILFILCLIVGYCSANKFFPQKTSTAQATKTQVSNLHSNLIIINVDNLKNNAPTLLSVWGIFLDISKDKVMGMAFKPLYPITTSDELNQEFKDRFSLDSNSAPSPEFLQDLAKTYNFPWDNYLVVDNNAIMVLSDWITGIPYSFEPTAAANKEEAKILIDQQQTLLLDVCQSLNAENLQQKPKFNWQKLLPKHIITDLPNSNFIDNWNQIITSQKPSQCQILNEQ
jgi:hypothetical protein